MTRELARHLQAEMAFLESAIADTPEDDVIERTSLSARLEAVASELQQLTDAPAPARVRLTFRGRPVVSSHGIAADFGLKAVSGFADCVAAIAASLNAPLAPSGRIPSRDQHQLLITSTAGGSFGFDLEEPRPGLFPGEPSPVAQALDRAQLLLRGTQGTDDELADSAADTDRRALDKMRAFLQTLADNEAVCTVQVGESVVRFHDVGQVRTSLERLRQDHLRESREELRGELRGVLPDGRQFECRLADSGLMVRGKVGPAIETPDELQRYVGKQVVLTVSATRVGVGRPRYVLLALPVVVS
jgi:hypothetical protein